VWDVAGKETLSCLPPCSLRSGRFQKRVEFSAMGRVGDRERENGSTSKNHGFRGGRLVFEGIVRSAILHSLIFDRCRVKRGSPKWKGRSVSSGRRGRREDSRILSIQEIASCKQCGPEQLIKHKRSPLLLPAKRRPPSPATQVRSPLEGRSIGDKRVKIASGKT